MRALEASDHEVTPQPLQSRFRQPVKVATPPLVGPHIFFSLLPIFSTSHLLLPFFPYTYPCSFYSHCMVEQEAT